MDMLSPFLSRFSLTARVFLAGHICGTTSDHATKMAGHLHVLRSGVLNILNKGGEATVLREPTLLFYPRPEKHIFQTEGADIVCAFVEFGAGMLNPLATALPNLLVVPLASIPELQPTVTLLFAESVWRPRWKAGGRRPANRVLSRALTAIGNGIEAGQRRSLNGACRYESCEGARRDA